MHFPVDVTDQCGARFGVFRRDAEWCYKGAWGVVVEGAFERVVRRMWDSECDSSSSWFWVEVCWEWCLVRKGVRGLGALALACLSCAVPFCGIRARRGTCRRDNHVLRFLQVYFQVHVVTRRAERF